jgi:hypothetical protein
VSLDDGQLVGPPAGDVAVDGVGARVQHAAGEPAGRRLDRRSIRDPNSSIQSMAIAASRQNPSGLSRLKRYLVVGPIQKAPRPPARMVADLRRMDFLVCGGW